LLGAKRSRCTRRNDFSGTCGARRNFTEVKRVVARVVVVVDNCPREERRAWWITARNMCCTNDLDEVFVGRPNTGNQHKTFPVAKREKRENQFPIPLGLGFAS